MNSSPMWKVKRSEVRRHQRPASRSRRDNRTAQRIPRLKDWLGAVARELEETEREEAFRLRWARSGSASDGEATG